MTPIHTTQSIQRAGRSSRPGHRFLNAAFLTVVVVSAAAAWGCGSGTSRSGFAGGSDDGGGAFGDGGEIGDGAPAPSIAGLASITLTPPMTALSLQYPVAPPGATTQLQAMGTFMDGHMSDVTASVAWSVSPNGIANVGGGAFSSLSAGTFTITALAGSITSNPVTVTVKLTGTLVGMGVTQGDLDGTPSGGPPTIAYPLNGALIPYQLGPIEFQVVPTSAAQTEARIAFEGDNIDLKVYEPCLAIPNAAIANGCTITVPSDLEQTLDGASEGMNMTETVRLAAPGGASLAESAPLGARWSASQLHGGLYYWSASLTGGNTLIMRYNLDTPGTPPEQYFTEFPTAGMTMSDEQNMDPPASSGSTACFGCHAISLDGKKIGLTFGGSAPANFALIDVASKKTIATRLFAADPGGSSTPFAAFTAFSPDGTAMVQSVGGQLMLRTADANLTTITPNLFAATLGAEAATTPFWSPKGDLLAFTGWIPNPAMTATAGTDPKNTNGDETPDAEIWITSVTGDMTFGTPTLLVPKDATGQHTEHYPAISDDSLFVVFNESSCSGPAAPAGELGYGGSPCDGYDDPSATVRMVSAKGGSAVNLTNASQNDNWSNSWPRFAPTHGTFQGKNLYWIAFSSRHPYGATLPGTNNPAQMDTEPQLWFAAVVLDPSGMLSADPSFAPGVDAAAEPGRDGDDRADGSTRKPLAAVGRQGHSRRPVSDWTHSRLSVRARSPLGDWEF